MRIHFFTAPFLLAETGAAGKGTAAWKRPIVFLFSP